MLNLIVFSKDRACQLDLLLRSGGRLVEGWRTLRPVVLYTASDELFEAGYERAARMHPSVRLVREIPGAFREQTIHLIDESRVLTSFLVDDDVFTRPFAPTSSPVSRFVLAGDVLALSLRLGPSISYCYALDEPSPPPALGPALTWEWRDASGDWAYPMSLDGHVFRTPEILGALHRVRFSNPNSLEAALADNPLCHGLLACLDEARLVNVPANRVQDGARNRSMGLSAASFNERFLGGERLALTPFLDLETPSVHFEIDYVWEAAAEEKEEEAAA